MPKWRNIYVERDGSDASLGVSLDSGEEVIKVGFPN